MNLDYCERQTRLINRPLFNVTSWYWPISDDSTFNIIVNDYMKNIRPVLLKRMSSGVAVQAGGNCGVYPMLLTEMFKFVYTFEPDPLSFHCLTRNCQSDTIIKFNTGLSDGFHRFMLREVSASNRGMNKIDGFRDDGPSISIALDGLAIPDVSLIMLDVEGHERFAIKGAIDTIERCKPFLILEGYAEEIGGIYNEYLSHLYAEPIHLGSSNYSFSLK